MIPVDQRARLIETEAAVRVAVVGDADVRPAFEHRTAQRVQMRRAAAVVDVHPIRERVDHLDVGTEATQHLRHRLIGCTVRAVEDDLHAVETLGTRAHHVVDVLVEEIVAILHHADILSRWTRFMVAVLQLADKSLQLVLYGIGQLVAVTAKELDAVIGERIVRRRDHNARVHLMLTCEIGNRRRWHDPREESGSARRADARRQRSLEHLARDTRIAPDQNARAYLGMCSEIECRRASKLISQLRCKLRICHAAYAIRPKKSHNNSLLCIFNIICCASECTDPHTVTYPLSSP